MPTIIDTEELGRRIRKLRLDRRMTLKQVEALSALSATHLSELERGRTSPTIGALVRIARALEKDASFFLEIEERPDVAHLMREQVTAVAPAPVARVELLTHGIPGSEMFAYRVHLQTSEKPMLQLPAQDLPGDAIYHVQSGRLVAEIGDSVITLAAGDSMQASFSHAHALRAEGDEPAEFHLISTQALEGTR